MAQHPLWRSSLEDLGDDPPWDEAREILISRQFQRSWANQLDWGIGPVIAYLMLAGIEYTAMRAGDPLPLPPSLKELMAVLESEATET